MLNWGNLRMDEWKGKVASRQADKQRGTFATDLTFLHMKIEIETENICSGWTILFCLTLNLLSLVCFVLVNLWQIYSHSSSCFRTANDSSLFLLTFLWYSKKVPLTYLMKELINLHIYLTPSSSVLMHLWLTWLLVLQFYIFIFSWNFLHGNFQKAQPFFLSFIVFLLLSLLFVLSVLFCGRRNFYPRPFIVFHLLSF